jgi:acylphosphatase
MNERMETVVSGRVQGVTFREFTTRNARRLRLAGTVKNQEDGTVYVVAEGTRNQLEKLLAKLHTGPLFSHVEHISVSWLPAMGEFSTFEISYE